MSNFGSKLKQLRLSKQLTQQDLAKLMGISRATIAGYESSGKQPDQEKLNWIADYFHVTTDYLLGRSVSNYSDFEPELSVTIGKRLSHLRKFKKITKRDMAKVLNVENEDVIDLIENGHTYPDFHIISKIINYFDVPLNYLLGYTDDPTPATSNDLTRPYTPADWEPWMASLPQEEQEEFAAFENHDFSDEDKVNIMEDWRKAKIKKQKKVNRFSDFTDDVIDEAYRYAKYISEERKKRNEN